MHVLVADDDEDIRFLTCIAFGRRGWQTTVATNGLETIATIESSAAMPFDVLVLDQSMPPGSGLEVVDWLRSRGDHTPVILFTGYVSALDMALVEGRGVTVLDKVAISQLPGLVEQLAASD